MLMRHSKMIGHQVVTHIRLVEGIEMMQLIGFDASLYNPSHPLGAAPLSNMAGNAFSAFAATPFAIAACALFGIANVSSPQAVSSSEGDIGAGGCLHEPEDDYAGLFSSCDES